MKELTLRDIQLVSLDILKDIRAFCDANAIRYFMAYGTLLGAVRHKGFIPWDDDIDLMMPRPDYERFIREYRSLDGMNAVFYHEKDGSGIAFARVCDMKRTVLKFNGTSWAPFETGVFIDVFPLDATTPEEYPRRKKQAMKQLYYTYLERGLQQHTSTFFKNAVKRVILFVTSGGVKKLIDISTRFPYEASTWLGQFTCPDAHETVLRKEWFATSVLLDFEGDRFAAPVGYTDLLTNQFGNFMQLPPEKDRVPHISMARFYWK